MKQAIKALSFAMILFSYVNPQGAIVILNGTSTAGKSSIIKKIKNCVDISFDKTAYNLIAEVVENKIETLDQKWIKLLVSRGIVTKETTMSSTKYKLPRNNLALIGKKVMAMEKLVPNFIPITDIEHEDCVERTEATMTKKALQLSDEEQTVIIDTVMEERSQKKAFERAFKGRKLYFVLVYCPPAKLVSRVRTRNKMAMEAGLSNVEVRELETPIEQFLRIYTVSDDSQRNPLLVSLENPADARVSQVTLKAIFENGADLFGKKYDVESLKKTTIEQWSLQSRRFATIAPKDRYDLIVDNGPSDAAANCARQIQRLIAPTRTRPQKNAWQKFWDFVLCRRK